MHLQIFGGGEKMKICTNKVKRLMWANLMTQSALAQAAGVSRVTINSALLKGSCSTVTAGKIANALGVDPEELIKEE